MKNINKMQSLIRLLCDCNVPNTVYMVGERENRFGHEEEDVSTMSYVNMMVNVRKYYIQVLADDL